VDLGIGTAEQLRDMRLNRISEKSRVVLKALAKGLSYEQILAVDGTLTAHDFFRALSESPPGFWDPRVVSNANNGHAERFYVQ
jgi:hypothetical protein